MKKIYATLLLFITAFALNAQTRQAGPWVSPVHVSSNPLQIQTNELRAAGDTLMYMPLEEVFVNPTDSPSFSVVTEDIDMLTTYNSGVPVDFGVVYNTTADTTAGGVPTGDNFYQAWEDPLTDSAFYWYATSWFNPAGIANNWLMFGPVTIPTGGAIISWYERCNPAYRDGYKVFATSTPSVIVTYTDFTDPAFYTRTSAYPSPTYVTDTTWVLKSVAVPASYNGIPIYFGYNHDANDMDVLYIDEITVTEAPVGIASGNTASIGSLSQNIPNPASHYTTISYSLEKPSNVSFDVYDVTGRNVMSENLGYKSPGTNNYVLNAGLLDAGVYFYTLTTAGGTVTQRMSVSK